MAVILVKAYIRQLFGKPDIHLFEFDSQSAGIAELREEISKLVEERAVELTWLDQDGDQIRLSTDEQLKFAITHGVKDNVLRVSVRVDWLNVQASRRLTNRSEAMAVEGEEETPEAGVDAGAEQQEEGGTGEAAEGNEEAGAASVATGGCNKAKCRRRARKAADGAHYSGYVRTVGDDGVARERNLSAEEAAYLLNRSSSVFNTHRSPFSLASSSLFADPTPRVEYRNPFSAPYYLTW